MPLANEPPRVNLRLPPEDDKFVDEEIARRGMTKQDFFLRLLRDYRQQSNLVQLKILGQLSRADKKLVADLQWDRIMAGK